MENIFDYVRKNKTKSRRCNCCDTLVLKEPKKEGYPYFCTNCQKYLFEIETNESYRPATPGDIIDVLEQLSSMGK